MARWFGTVLGSALLVGLSLMATYSVVIAVRTRSLVPIKNFVPGVLFIAGGILTSISESLRSSMGLSTDALFTDDLRRAVDRYGDSPAGEADSVVMVQRLALDARAAGIALKHFVATLYAGWLRRYPGESVPMAWKMAAFEVYLKE